MIKLKLNTPSLAPEQASKAKKSFSRLCGRQDVGFLNIELLQKNTTDILKYGQIIKDNFDTLVVIGIGGSALGIRAIEEIYQNTQKKILICDNVDQIELHRIFRSINNLQKTAWLVVSKSGISIETLMSFDIIFQQTQKLNIDIKQNTFFITELKSNPLFDLAKSWQRPVLEIPESIGGRFSILTAVGLLPAFFLGQPTMEFIQGARLAFNNEEIIVRIAAECMASWQREEWITLFWNYSSILKSFGGWLQQLWSESLAKKEGPRVSTPLIAIGACDQHSLLQQIIEGAKDKMAIFLQVAQSDIPTPRLENSLFPQHKFLQGKSVNDLLAAELMATSQALTQNQISNLILQVDNLQPKTMGELFMTWQLIVATLGEALHINAFNQPGVELGKRLAKEILTS